MCWQVAAIVLSFEMTEMACAGSVSAGDKLAGESGEKQAGKDHHVSKDQPPCSKLLR